MKYLLSAIMMISIVIACSKQGDFQAGNKNVNVQLKGIDAYQKLMDTYGIENRVNFNTLVEFETALTKAGASLNKINFQSVFTQYKDKFNLSDYFNFTIVILNEEARKVLVSATTNDTEKTVNYSFNIVINKDNSIDVSLREVGGGAETCTCTSGCLRGCTPNEYACNENGRKFCWECTPCQGEGICQKTVTASRVLTVDDVVVGFNAYN